MRIFIIIIFISLFTTSCFQEMCSPNQCENNGLCLELKDSYKCECKKGSSGDNCEFKVENTGDNIFVDTKISLDSCTTYNLTTRTCTGGSFTAYKSISDASLLAVAGKSVFIREGTYNEKLVPQHSGTVTDLITFARYASEIVQLKGSPAIEITDKSYIILDGFNVEDTTWLEARNSHHITLKNSTFLRNSTSGTTGNIRFISSNNNKIFNNTISGGQDNLLLIDANYNVVENNNISEAGNSVWGIRCGDYNIIRGNTFSNTIQKIGEVYDCGVDTNAVDHSFDSTSHNLIENNIFAGTASYSTSSSGNGIQYSGQKGIIRNNEFYKNNVGLGMASYGDEALYTQDNRIYNNVFYDNNCAGLNLGSNTGNIFKNNIVYANHGSSGDCLGEGPTQILYNSSLSDYQFFNNSVFGTVIGENIMLDQTGTGNNITYLETNHPLIYSSNIEADPKFTNVQNYDFTLLSSSPVINAATFVTQTTSAGSGLSLTVSDASYFYDGYDIVGELGDLIQLEGQTVKARIVKIDYTTNIITLDQSLSWENNQGVHLVYSGAAPDIGAYEYQE